MRVKSMIVQYNEDGREVLLLQQKLYSEMMLNHTFY